MKISPAHAPAAASPLTWFLVEQRGPATAHGPQYDLTTLEISDIASGDAVLADGTLSFPGDRGNYASMQNSTADWVRDGVDPDAALRGARDGVAALEAAINRAGNDLARFAVPTGTRLPRDPDTFEIWLRRESGERGRYIVPYADTPASVRDIQRAMTLLADQMRRDFELLDPPQTLGQVHRRSM